MDPIADMLTAIRNALAVKKETVIIPYSKIKFNLAQILKDKGFLEEVHRRGRGTVDKKIEIVLRYDSQGRPVMDSLKRKSRPGQRLYVKKSQIKPVRQSLGLAILSTPQGLMTGAEARKAGLGGELICEVY